MSYIKPHKTEEKAQRRDFEHPFQRTFRCSKATIETLAKSVKYVQS